MRFCTGQQQFYCGIDLHARTRQVCVLSNDGQVVRDTTCLWRTTCSTDSSSSMSHRADCWDIAPMESFFASLKKELDHGADFATKAAARAVIVAYIEVFYNNQRRHSSLGYVSPAEYEQSKHS